MAIKTKGQLAADLISILTNGGLLTATEDRTLRQNSYDSLAALLGNNAFVGDQGVTGALSVSGGITPSDLTASKLVLTDSSKKLVSSTYAYTEYKRYTALISQAGTSAPTVTVLENTVGTIVWTYSSTGVYVGTLTGAFPASKIFWTLSSQNISLHGAIARVDDNSIQIGTRDTSSGSLANDLLSSTPIEIRVYP